MKPWKNNTSEYFLKTNNCSGSLTAREKLETNLPRNDLRAEKCEQLTHTENKKIPMNKTP